MGTHEGTYFNLERAQVQACYQTPTAFSFLITRTTLTFLPFFTHVQDIFYDGGGQGFVPGDPLGRLAPYPQGPAPWEFPAVELPPPLQLALSSVVAPGQRPRELGAAQQRLPVLAHLKPRQPGVGVEALESKVLDAAYQSHAA